MRYVACPKNSICSVFPGVGPPFSRASPNGLLPSTDGLGRSTTWAGLAVPLRGETACGDAFAMLRDGSGWTALLADGLGHGLHAAEASNAAVQLFRAHGPDLPANLLGMIHAGLRHTRGAALSIARYEVARDVIVFAGVGNVAGAVIVDGVVKRMVSHAGTAGMVARRIQEFEQPFTPGSLLVMHSDGVSGNWDLADYAGLSSAHPV